MYAVLATAIVTLLIRVAIRGNAAFFTMSIGTRMSERAITVITTFNLDGRICMEGEEVVLVLVRSSMSSVEICFPAAVSIVDTIATSILFYVVVEGGADNDEIAMIRDVDRVSKLDKTQ